jgi:1-phosphofructokinase family hexose kinase
MAALVISLNPAIDCEWRLKTVVAEEKNEIASEFRWPGGKGINVARWLGWLKVSNRLFVPLGGATGRELVTGLRAETIRFVRFPLSKPNRVNVVVTPDSGPQYRFNQAWARLTLPEARRLVGAAAKLAATADPVAICGTLAFGAPVDSYARIARAARLRGRRVFLDCDREPFVRALAERPFLVKPNEFELGQWVGRELRDEASVRSAGRALSAETGGYVLVSRAAAGALLINVNLAVELTASVPGVVVRNTVGAGDAMLAGAVAASLASEAPEALLRWAVATGCAATEVAPGKLPTVSRWRALVKAVPIAPL